MSAIIKEENGLKRKLEFTVPSQQVDECFFKKLSKSSKIS